MSRFLVLFICFLFFSGIAFAQQPDSLMLPKADTVQQQDTTAQRDTVPNPPQSDSFSRKPVFTGAGWVMKDGGNNSSITKQVLDHHPYYGFGSVVKTSPGQAVVKRQFTCKEWLFYLLITLLIIYGFLKLIFPKYFSDLFRLFFRTTIKQRQIKEQLMQTPLPSLLLNAFFILTAGLYASFMLQYFDLNTIGNFWILLLYCCGGLSLVYFVKFAGLKISGWLFNMEEAADSYIFIVFVVNKMLGLLLLPFLILISFAVGQLYSAGLALSWCLVGSLLVYRFILTYSAIRNQVKVNPFHFFLYLCAFEIAPLLLIYKGLLLFFSITA